ncbi:pilus assembly protein PilM [Peptostreptococcaceae bacterium oral taxon 081]|nr:pilus assembly protein PilM [Peptostreptococcaceae bacterium oral taxon 081]
MDIKQNEVFFALDIGTRSIMGILGEKDGDIIKIKNVAMELHKKRAMYDGQVHDIQAVADVAQLVRGRLEKESGIKLTDVAIAAAGRSLKTIQTNVTEEFEEETLIDSQIMKNIEIEVLQQAANILKENLNDNVSYYNVGHTVMTYKLDDYEIKNPNGHKGKKISLEIIATFLPKIVVEALDSVMHKIDLNISYMTLEPIVALEVAIPENVRLLNIAMVDIGAGTSDIAITKDGIIIGYSMTSTAGDEITEALSRKFLLDFDTAENIKCNLCKSSEQSFTDIVGTQINMTTNEILEEIQDSIDLVAKNISDAILKTNGKSPSAVFLIGGGSQLPTLNKLVADNLQLQESRVVVKSIENIQNIEYNTPVLEGPQSITPVGILTCAIKNERKDFMEIKVNDKKIKLFRSADLKISDALILAGFNPRDLISRKGKSILVTINGNKKIFNGTYGEEAQINLNNQKANIDTNIHDGDTISIEPATSGQNAQVSIKDLISEKYIYINDDIVPYFCNIKINSIECKDYSTMLENGDEISYDILDSTDKIRQNMNIADDKQIFINGEFSKYDLSVEPNDKIKISDMPKEKETSDDVQSVKKSITVIYNGSMITIKSKRDKILFIDIFDNIDFDRSKPKGNLIMKHNGNTAELTSELRNGDRVEIFWEEKNNIN